MNGRTAKYKRKHHLHQIRLSCLCRNSQRLATSFPDIGRGQQLSHPSGPKLLRQHPLQHLPRWRVRQFRQEHDLPRNLERHKSLRAADLAQRSLKYDALKRDLEGSKKLADTMLTKAR